MVEHLAARPCVAADHHASGAHIGPEGLREGAREAGSQELAHHAADAGDADLQQMFARHQAKLLTSSSKASKSSFGGSPRCSQIMRTMGSVWLTRTWNQRSGQSTRRPSRTLTRPSLKRARRSINRAGMRCVTRGTWPFRMEYFG